MQHSSRRYQTPPVFGAALWSVSSSIRHDVMSVQQHLCRLASNFEYATFYVLYSWPPTKTDKYITHRSIAKREPSHGHRYIARRGNLVKVWTCDCGNVRADINTERQTDTLIAILRSRIDRAAVGTEFLPPYPRKIMWVLPQDSHTQRTPKSYIPIPAPCLFTTRGLF